MYCRVCDAEVIPEKGDSECPVCGRIFSPEEEQSKNKTKKDK